MPIRLFDGRNVFALVTTCALACGASDDSSEVARSVAPSSDEQAGSNTATTAGARLADRPGPDGLSAGAAASEPAARPPVPLPYRGVNLAGGEFGSALPGTLGTDYAWPTTEEVDYYMSKGMNTFRVGFRWERLQSSAYASFTPVYLASLDSIVTYATTKGANVILNPHNFARYYGDTVGSAQVPSAVFADLWSRLATKYASNTRVMFNLVNEPHDMPTEQWVSAANAAISAIRAAGATNLIHVPGNAWTGAHSWSSTGYGTPNAIAMLDVVDPADNMLFEVHQYLDASSGGGSDACVSATIGRERLASFISWLRANGRRGFIGEFAGGNNATCASALNDMLQSMMSANDVLDGWLWWAGGPAWGDYPFSSEPKDGQDSPHMQLLLPHLAGLPTPTL